MKYLLDTNVLSDFVRGEQSVTARLRQEAPPQLAVSVITEMEVEYGLARNPNVAPCVREAMRTLLNTISVLTFEREDGSSVTMHVGATRVDLAAWAAARGGTAQDSVVLCSVEKPAEIAGLLEAASGGQRRCAANHNGAGARGLSFWFGLFCPLRV